MTKEKLKWIFKRLPYILEMLYDGESEISVYISGEKERIIIDEDVFAVMDIMDEIIEAEETEWRKKIFAEIRKGYKDIKIMINSPMGSTKYYEEKKEFIPRLLMESKDLLGQE